MNEATPEKPSAPVTGLHTVLAELIRRHEAGEQIDLEACCAQYPEFADGLKSYFQGQGLVDALAGQSDDSGRESTDSRAAETVRPGAKIRTDVATRAEFGRYKILKMLGEGAMGAIYLAEDSVLGRQVALKIPKFSGLEGEDFQQRFTREARSAARLDHPNICRVHDAGEINGTPFISMEYIQGQPLSKLVGSAELREIKKVVELTLQLADGLAHAHEQGILHRDLKPGNVLMKRGEIPCITDFGLARTVDSQEESRITHEGAILGTPAYMSPEQIEGKQDLISPASDVYALGVMLFELLTGRLPFRGNVMSILGQALRDRPPRLQKFRPEIDPQLEDFCLQMLEKKPSQRPASMQEVKQFLQQWLDGTSENQSADQPSQQKSTPVEDQQELTRQIQQLVKQGQFSVAVSELEKVLASADSSKPLKSWAAKKRAEVQQLPAKYKQRIPSLYKTAQQCKQKNDYGQAAQLLQQIPQAIRPEAVQNLLDEMVELQEEADLLLADLKKCVRTRELTGIEENLVRFLELKPGNRFARQLQEALQTYQSQPVSKRQYHFNERGELKPLNEDSPWMGWLIGGLACFVLVFGVAYGGIMLTLKNKSQTITVEVEDTWLRQQGGELQLEVDGQEYHITSPQMNVTIQLGEHDFTVSNGDTVVHNPETFTIEKGGDKVLQINSERMLLTTREMLEPKDSPVQPPANISIASPAVTESAAAKSLSGLKLVAGSKFTGSYIQQSPVATHDIEVTLKEQRDGVWRGEFQSLRARIQGSNEPYETGFRFNCELKILSPDSASLSITALTGNESGLTVRDTTSNWVEQLQWDGKSLVNGPMKLTPATTSANAIGDEWTELFNGRDFSGWQQYKGGVVSKGWEVRNGEICIIGEGDDIMTTQTYSDFELEFEWAMPDGGNSGVFYRVGTVGGDMNATGIEFQIFDDPTHTSWNDPNLRSGAIWPLYGKIVPLKPRGEFNTAQIVVYGNQITHWLNGVKTAEATIDGSDWKQKTQERIKNRPQYATLKSGHIGLQTYGQDVRFRNIRIRKITSETGSAQAQATPQRQLTPLKTTPADPFAGKKQGDIWQANSIGQKFVWIPAGQFRMGSLAPVPDEPNETPANVEFTFGRWVAETEVTQQQWESLMGFAPWTWFADKIIGNDVAATHVTWDEAVDYCQRLTNRDRRLGKIPIDWEYRLPSEAEWEYFSRAGTNTTFYFGEDVSQLDQYAWTFNNTSRAGEHYAHRVGLKKPNPWGLFDVHGNVYEWCYDSYQFNLPGGIDPAVVDPPISGKHSRGGGWSHENPADYEISNRRHLTRDSRRNNTGLRLVVAPVNAFSAKGYGNSFDTNSLQPIKTESLAADQWFVAPQSSEKYWTRNGQTLIATHPLQHSIAWSKNSYQDFEVSLEVKFSDRDKGNGGVVLRAPSRHGTFSNMLEVHLGDGEDRYLPHTRFPSSGGLYVTNQDQPPDTPVTKTNTALDVGTDEETYLTGRWNPVRIRLVGPILTVHINNRLTLWRNLEDMTIPYPHMAETLQRESGYIGLQHYVGQSQYRNIQIVSFDRK